MIILWKDHSPFMQSWCDFLKQNHHDFLEIDWEFMDKNPLNCQMHNGHFQSLDPLWQSAHGWYCPKLTIPMFSQKKQQYWLAMMMWLCQQIPHKLNPLHPTHLAGYTQDVHDIRAIAHACHLQYFPAKNQDPLIIHGLKGYLWMSYRGTILPCPSPLKERCMRMMQKRHLHLAEFHMSAIHPHTITYFSPQPQWHRCALPDEQLFAHLTHALIFGK